MYCAKNVVYQEFISPLKLGKPLSTILRVDLGVSVFRGITFYHGKHKSKNIKKHRGYFSLSNFHVFSGLENSSFSEFSETQKWGGELSSPNSWL